MRNLQEIQLDLSTTQNPDDLANLKIELATQYSHYSGSYEQILAKKPGTWKELRVNEKTDKATDRAWEATEAGISEVRLKLRLKAIEKLISSVSSKIGTVTNERHYS
jgi:hypothetical protein